jgi:hypothetical protein
MSSLGALLDGCQSDAGDDGVMRMRCSGDVVLAVKPKTAGEPQYKSEAYGIAQNAGARLVWDQIVVPTEGESGLVDRAQAKEPGSDLVKGTLLGVVRPLANGASQEVWCSCGDNAGVDRCKALVGAVLGSAREASTATTSNGATSASGATSTNGATSDAGSPPQGSGPATVFGRALSLPTSCVVQQRDDGGADAKCKDGASLTWRKFNDMDEASQTVNATLAALGDEDDGDGFACTIVGEVGRCEAHAHGLAGLTYLDGKALAVLCVGVSDPVHHSLCRALMQPK